MQDQWIDCLLGDVINLKRGYDLTKQQFVEGPYPIVTSSGIISYHNQSKVRGPGVVTGRYGTLGEIFYIKSDFWPHNTALYVENFKGNFPLFINYLLKTLNFQFQNAAGAVPGVNRNYLHMMKVTIPPLPTQQKIAAILSAYDDLIENNTRRIKILEEMAQALYREWFVNFRFPGHEGLRMVESELGLVPEGWDVQTVEETFSITGGGTPSTKAPEYWENGEINWYSPTDLTSSGTMFMDCSGNQINESGLKNSSAKLFSPFSVMMTSRATLGVISINTTDACTNQGFITCIPNEHFPLYTLYHWLKENVETFNSLGTGSTFKEITKGVFKTIQLVVPPPEISSQFEQTVQPLAFQILNLQRKNNNLRRTRDLLLPKLISGEFDVSELDILIPEEMAA